MQKSTQHWHNVTQQTEVLGEISDPVPLYQIIRRIYGPKYENGEWKSRTNRELEEISKGENILKWIKGQRISWLGHLERIGEDRMPKKNWKGREEGEDSEKDGKRK
jgi:hypothetical protein